MYNINSITTHLFVCLFIYICLHPIWRNYVNVTDGGSENDPEVSLLDGISLTKTTTV